MQEILTDWAGRPIPKPQREDYSSTEEYLRAKWTYRNRVTAIANQAFVAAFQREVRQ